MRTQDNTYSQSRVTPTATVLPNFRPACPACGTIAKYSNPAAANPDHRVCIICGVEYKEPAVRVVGMSPLMAEPYGRAA